MDRRKALSFLTGLRFWSPCQAHTYVIIHLLAAPYKELKFHKLWLKGEKSTSLEKQGQPSESQLDVKQHVSHLLKRNQGRDEGQRVGAGKFSGGVSFSNSYNLELWQKLRLSRPLWEAVFFWPSGFQILQYNQGYDATLLSKPTWNRNLSKQKRKGLPSSPSTHILSPSLN